MIRHVVMFRFKEEAGEAERRSVSEGLSALPDSIPEIVRYDHGSDLELREGNFDYVLVAEFADAQAFERYVGHPEHQRFVRERLTPAASERVAVQYSL